MNPKRLDQAAEELLRLFDLNEIVPHDDADPGRVFGALDELRAAWLERNQAYLICIQCGAPVPEQRSYAYEWCIACFARAAQNTIVPEVKG